MGAAVQAKAAILKHNNLTASATVKIQANTTDSWDSPAFEATLTTINNDIMITHFDKTYRWWRIYIDDDTNDDGFISLGRVFLGSYFQPSRYIHEGYTLSRIDPSALALTEGGQISSIQRTKYRRLTYLFSGMTSSDKTSFEAMFASRGLAKDLFVCDDTDNAQSNTYYVRLANDLEIRHLTGDKFEIAITPEELR